LQIGAELHPARFHVGAAHVQLVARDRRRIIEHRHHRGELLDLIAHHVHQDSRAPQIVREPREVLCLDLLDARIGEAHGVDHPAIELSDARRPRPVSPLDANRLRDEPPESVEIDHPRELATVGGRASGKQHRILKFDTRDSDFERGRGHRYRAPPIRDS